MKFQTISMLCLLSSLFIFTGCNEDKKQTDVKTKPMTINVDVHTLKKETYPIWIEFTGKTEAIKDVMIVPRNVTGELKTIHFKAGDIVKKDQLLFKIDDSQYKAVLAQKKALLKKDEANLALAIANVNRYEPLVKKALAPKEQLDQLVANKKQLQAAVKADQATIKQAELDVQYTNVVSTIDGKIGKNLVDIGNIVTPSTQLANIVQSQELYVNFNPSSNQVSLIKKYRKDKLPKVIVYPEHVEKDIRTTLDGQVDFIDSVTNQTTGTVAMRAVVNNKEGLVFPGTFVIIQLFITDNIPVLALNPNNIGQNQLGSYVYIVNKENKIETRQIKIAYSNTDLAIVTEGLKEGERVVTSAIARLRNNLLVNAKEVANPIVIKE